MIHQRLLQPVLFFAGQALPQAAEPSGAPGRIAALLDQFSDTARFAPPIAVVPVDNGAILRAIDGHFLDPLIIAVPAGTPDTTAAILSSLARPVRQRSSHYALIPGGLALDAPDNLASLIHDASVTARLSGMSVVFARRASAGEQHIVFETVPGSQQSHLLTVRAAGHAGTDDRFAVPLEMGQLYVHQGPVIVAESALVEAARQNTTAVISSCSSAMAVAGRKGRIVFPNAGFMSLVPGQPLIELLAGHPEDLLIHPGGELFRVNGGGSPAADGQAPEPDLDIGQAGEESSRPWGRTTLISEEESLQIRRLCLHPGQKATWPSSPNRMLHWLVVSGSAFIKTGNDLKTAGPGENLRVAPGDKHAITNIGASELVIYEICMTIPEREAQKPVARYG